LAKKHLRKLRTLQEQQELSSNITPTAITPPPAVTTAPPRKNIASNPAFVVGNGRSRLPINPKELLKEGIVYGCNAQYREYEPHYLIAVDVKMVNEIIAAGYHKHHQVWTNPNKGIQSKQNINFFNPHKGWSSGPTALWFAASQGHREIYILGFDYQGVDGKFNNVYADTFNYKKSTDSATFFGNWLSQTEKVIKEFRSVKFYRVIDSGAFIPDKLGPLLSNLSHITVEDFGKRFGSTIYSDQIDQKSTI
jgi:hypothetical protein